MIDVNNPDYQNTPASIKRPNFHYEPRDDSAPLVSIISPYYNTGPFFQETVLSIQQSSFAHWEWVLVDDGSTNAESLAQLERLQAAEPRVRVIHQANSGPGVARNRAAREARGRYLFQLDTDDLIEPTFIEKALWVLETQPQFAACNSFAVTFGSKNYLWPHGFEAYKNCLKENWVTIQALIRRDAFWEAGGYDESISYEHADWDFWLNLAEIGHWGFTIHEYLTWYRTQEKSLLVEIESDRQRAQYFRAWLRKKHKRLAHHFPHPQKTPSTYLPYPTLPEGTSIYNPLKTSESVKRILLLVPWLEIGGADKFNLDIVELLSKYGYQFTIATTLRSHHPWLSRFAQLTPDIFCLHQFLPYADYPRFLNYLIDSRQIDAVLVSNSELAYLLVPYLRARHPNVAILDYTHSEVEHWKDGGYPGMAVRAGRQFDLNVTNTHHLKDWMVARGADPERIEVCHCGIDTNRWSKEDHPSLSMRKRLEIAPETPIVLFIGRLAAEKRPLLLAKIIERVAAQEPNFVALVVGSGEQEGALRAFIRRHNLGQHIRLMGARPPEEVRELLATGEILLLPSQIEGLALVLLECMAMEVVPIAADVGGHRELVTPECGFLIPQGACEVEAYAEYVLQLLREPKRRQLMAKRAREQVVKYFDLHCLAERMSQVIERACNLASTRHHVEAADIESIRYDAHAAIAYMQREEGPEKNFEETGSPVLRLARRGRQQVLPIGTRRYEVYKVARQGLRRGMLSMDGRMNRIKSKLNKSEEHVFQEYWEEGYQARKLVEQEEITALKHDQHFLL